MSQVKKKFERNHQGKLLGRKKGAATVHPLRMASSGMLHRWALVRTRRFGGT
jgi:hypothetical protein